MKIFTSKRLNNSLNLNKRSIFFVVLLFMDFKLQSNSKMMN